RFTREKKSAVSSEGAIAMSPTAANRRAVPEAAWAPGRKRKQASATSAALRTTGYLRRPSQPLRELVGELTRLQAPAPVPLHGSRRVHPGLAPQPEHVLERHDRQVGAGGEGELDEAPVRLGAVETCRASLRG